MNEDFWDVFLAIGFLSQGNVLLAKGASGTCTMWNVSINEILCTSKGGIIIEHDVDSSQTVWLLNFCGAKIVWNEFVGFLTDPELVSTWGQQWIFTCQECRRLDVWVVGIEILYRSVVCTNDLFHSEEALFLSGSQFFWQELLQYLLTRFGQQQLGRVGFWSCFACTFIRQLQGWLAISCKEESDGSHDMRASMSWHPIIRS